jgi:hypothetical protein
MNTPHVAKPFGAGACYILRCSSCHLQAACVASFYCHRGLLYATIVTLTLKRIMCVFFIVADHQSLIFSSANIYLTKYSLRLRLLFILAFLGTKFLLEQLRQ